MLTWTRDEINGCLGILVRGILFREVIDLRRSEDDSVADDLRLDPEKRLCPKFDATSIALFPVAPPDEMGVRVVDNCAEEHIM